MTLPEDSNSGARVNVSRFLDRMGTERGDASALLIPRGRDRQGDIDYLQLSFRELAIEQDGWAARLRERGIQRGSRVLLMARPGLPLIALCFALFKIGAVPVVIDPGMGLRSFLACVRRSEPEALVGIGIAIWVSRIFRSAFRSVRTKVMVGGPLSRAPVAENGAGIQAAETRSDDLAAILFTSGSTGAPKGVCYEHGMFEAQVEAIRAEYGIEPGEVDLPMLPIFALFNPALGMTTVVPEINPSKPATVDPAKIVQAIEQCGVTNSFGSPVLWKKIGAYCAKRGKRLPSLKRILMAGASAPPELMRQFRGLLKDGHAYSPYGATEVLPVSSISDEAIIDLTRDDALLGKGTCVGRPLPGVEVRILASSDGVLDASALDSPVEQGEIGEIVVTGPSVTKQYDRLPGPTREAKILEGSRVWHRMGDLGYFDLEGRLWFCGRKVERVETGDAVFFTDCCEGVFNRLEEVYRSALIAYSVDGKTVPAIAIEPMPDCFPENGQARDAFIAKLIEIGSKTDATRPIDRFVFQKAFPVDVRHNAKIHRLALAKRITAGSMG